MSQFIVCLRYDDWGLYEEAIEYDKTLVKIAESYSCPITLSIVPQSPNLEKEKKNLFDKAFYKALEKGNIEIAMHGYKHRRGFLEKLLHVYGEFGKKPYAVQKKELSKGIEILGKYINCPIKIFVPPYNVYDKNTVKILSDLKFDLISDGPSANLMFGYDATDGAIERLPFTCGIENVCTVIDEKDEESDASTYCFVALFHHYNYDIKKVEELVSTLSQKSNVRFSSLQDLHTIVDSGQIESMQREKAKFYYI